jgi:uncharacterized protein YjbJ (UPF0337 family)
MADRDRIEGTLQNVTGKVQDAVGGLSGDAGTQVEGKTRQAAGKIQNAYGDTLESARGMAADVGRSVEQQPLLAVLIAGALGLMLGGLLVGSLISRR